MKPAAYCSQIMLDILRNAGAGRGPTEGLEVRKANAIASAIAALQSRGWITKQRAITAEGRAYLLTRGDQC